MPRNPFGHVDIRVTDREAALKFYSAWLPELGFSRFFQGKMWNTFAAEGEFPGNPAFGFTEDKEHQGNANRLAFWVESKAEVDRLGQLVKEAGGADIEGPSPCPEYTASYYALFFEDPSGNKLEIYFRED